MLNAGPASKPGKSSPVVEICKTGNARGSLKIAVKKLSDLTSADISAWRTAQDAHEDLSSPFYSPDYALAVDAARSDVLVGVIETDRDDVSFLPFHRRGGVGAPVGGPITDYQGLVGAAINAIDPGAVLRGLALNAYDFNHLPASNISFARGAFLSIASPCLDLSEGYEAYVQHRNSETKELKNTERKKRKIEREVGSLRFVANDTDPAAWRAMAEWKKASYERLGVRSILDVPWVDRTLQHIRAADTPEFSGALSTLYASDQLIAAHFGMRTMKTWHWWFPTYDTAMDKYSPGLILLMALAQHAAADGVSKIDLGRGSERYKSSFANDAVALCEGSVETGASPAALLRKLRKTLYRTHQKLPTDKGIDFQRRAFNRLLGVGRLPEH